MKKTFMQFLKFGVIGISNVFISYLINIIVLMLLKNYSVRCDYLIANIGGFVISVLWSFYWNEKYVFVQKKNEIKRIRIKRLIKMFICYSLSGVILNNILSYLWIEHMGISKIIAPLINIPISVPINFVLNKKWAFEE